MLNQQVHIHSGNAQGRWNCQSGSQCSINKFTHQLEMRKGDGIVRVAVSAQSTSPHTSWKCAREMESSEWQSVLNQQVHVQSGNAQGKWNCQSGSQCLINKFTYKLEMRKRDRIVRVAVSAQSTSSRTNWKCTREVESLEWVSAQSTSLHTGWKCTREMESLEQQSVLNQQIHIHPGNAQGRWNHQNGNQC